MDLADITYFFDCCLGHWSIERAYEEDRPLVSSFTYDQRDRELLMTTPYTKVTLPALPCSLPPVSQNQIWQI